MDIEKTLATDTPHTSTQSGTRMASEVMFSSGGRMVGRGLNFISQIMIARVLGPEVFGIFAIGWNVLRLLIIAGPLGLEQGVIRYGSKYWKQSPEKLKGIILTSALISLASGILLGLLMFLFSHPLAFVFFRKPDLEPVFQWLSVILPLSVLLHVLAAATTITQNIKYSVLFEEIGQPVLQMVVWISLLILKKGDLEGAMFSILLSYLLPVILIIIITVKIFPEIIHSKSNYSFLNVELFRFTIPTSAAVLFGSLISWGDRLIVGYFRTESETGIYQAISLVSVIFVSFLSGIKVVVGPAVARLFSQANHEHIEEIYTISTRWGLYFGLGIFALILTIGRELLILGYGQDYASGYVPLILLAFAQMINLGTGPLDMILIMMGRQNDWLRITIIVFFVSIVLGALMTSMFGLIGTAISTSITTIATFILGFSKLRKLIPVKPYNKKSLLALIGVGLASSIALLFRFSFPQLNPWLVVLGGTSIMVVFYGAWVVKLIATPQEKLMFMGAIITLRASFTPYPYRKKIE